MFCQLRMFIPFVKHIVSRFLSRKSLMLASSTLINNKGTYQPVHPHSLICALVIRGLEPNTDKRLVFVTEQAGFSLIWSKPTQDLLCLLLLPVNGDKEILIIDIREKIH